VRSTGRDVTERRLKITFGEMREAPSSVTRAALRQARRRHPAGFQLETAHQHPLSFLQYRLLDSRRPVDSFSWPSATHLAVGK
jgi:hypothetical protein